MGSESNTPSKSEYKENLSQKTGWDKFTYGSQYGYLGHTKSKGPKQGDWDRVRGRTLGYNDFQKGGIYGPETKRETDQPTDYAAHRENWNTNNPDRSDRAVLRARNNALASRPSVLGGAKPESYTSRYGRNLLETINQERKQTRLGAKKLSQTQPQNNENTDTPRASTGVGKIELISAINTTPVNRLPQPAPKPNTGFKINDALKTQDGAVINPMGSTITGTSPSTSTNPKKTEPVLTPLGTIEKPVQADAKETRKQDKPQGYAFLDFYEQFMADQKKLNEQLGTTTPKQTSERLVEPQPQNLPKTQLKPEARGRVKHNSTTFGDNGGNWQSGWNAFRQAPAQAYHDMTHGMARLISNITGLPVNEDKVRSRQAYIDSLVPNDKNDFLSVRVGKALGNGLASVSDLTFVGGTLGSVGKVYSDGVLKGLSPSDLNKNAVKEAVASALAHKAGSVISIGGKAIRNAGPRSVTGLRTGNLLDAKDNMVSATALGAAYGSKHGLDYLASEKDEKYSQEEDDK